MAHIGIRKLKNGEYSYIIQVKNTDPITKAVTFIYETWRNPNPKEIPYGKDGKGQAYILAKAYGFDFEKKKRNEVKTEESSIETKAIPTFSQIANEWLEVNPAFSPTYVARCKDKIKRFNEIWADKKITDFTSLEIKKYFANFSKQKQKNETAIIKKSAIEKLKNVLAARGTAREVFNKSEFSKMTYFSAQRGEQIKWKTAEAICNYLNIDVNEFFEKIIEEKPYKINTLLDFQSVLRSIFEYAIQEHYIEVNYASNKNLKGSIAGEEASEIQILTEKETEDLLKVLEKEDIEKSIPIYLMLYLGIRKAELCGLNWQSIDLDNAMIKITHNRVYTAETHIVRKPPKTKKSKREIPIFEPLLSKLKEYKEFYDKLKEKDPNFDNSGALFCNYDGQPRYPGYANKLLKNSLEMAKTKKITVHQLRHTWVSHLMNNQIPASLVSKLAGHANVNITLNIYTHINKNVDEARKCSKMFMNQINEELFKIKPKNR